MSTFFTEAVAMWFSGGWAMILLAINAFLLFSLGLSVKLRQSEKQYRTLSETRCREWIRSPEKRKGVLGELVSAAMARANLKQLETFFDEFRHTEVRQFERDLRLIQVCVSASPLLGLLGTVTGMLSTFYALAVGSGGEKTMDMVAGGISEALITTETGLIIAFPGLLFLHHLQRKHESYCGFLAHLETLCAQALHRRLGADPPA